MDTPIYSDNKSIGKENELQGHIIAILSEEVVQEINSKITFASHGIYLFSQYKEKRYIINSYAEEVFWNMISKLYVLLNDCGSDVLLYFLEPVLNDGKQSIKPFPVTSNSDVERFEEAKSFVEIVKTLRHTQQHNMKPDSVRDVTKERTRKKILKKISKKEVPESQEDWEKCIYWIWKECNNIYILLCERLDFVEKEATKLQKDFLLAGYYGCLEIHFDRNISDILAEIIRRKHKNHNDKYINAMVAKYKTEIISKTIELLKSSMRRVDPYKAILQAADSYIE